MENYKRIKWELFCLFFVCLIILCSFDAEALSITPPRVNLAYQPGSYQETVFQVSDVQNLDVNIEGDMLSYAKKPVITQNGEGMYLVKVGFDVPINMTPGEHDLAVIFMDKKSSGEGKTASVSAKMKMRVLISFVVPYPNKYMQISSWNWDKKVVKGNPLHINVNLHSYGKERVDKVSGKMIVRDRFEKNLVQEKSISEASNINLDEEANLEGALIMPENWSFGNYNVKAILNYDGQEIVTQEYYFIYGDLLLEILNVNPLEIGKGVIVPINIEVQNYWSEKVDFAAKVKVYDMNGNLVVEGVSSQGDVAPLGKGIVKLYLEGTNLKEGDYNLEVLLSYMGKEAKKNFVLKVTNKKNEVEAGQEVLNPENSEGNTLMIGLVVISILLLVLIIFFVFKKNQEGNSDI